jgi:hypothetical protein
MTLEWVWGAEGAQLKLRCLLLVAQVFVSAITYGRAYDGCISSPHEARPSISLCPFFRARPSEECWPGQSFPSDHTNDKMNVMLFVQTQLLY